ncbi:alpha/beta hydrolase, partial [Balneolaceae bacterium ANBcel3]|nr:alpha/beta hydrolase [Balneolaceae bacterium ANBcel3]
GAGMKPRRTLSFYFRKYSAKLIKTPFLLLPGSLKHKSLQWLRTTRIWKSLGSSEYNELSETMRQTFVKTVTEFLEPCLAGIEQDILLIWGRNDEATPLYQGERIEKGLKKGALVVLDHAGHYAFLDQPERFKAIVRAFYQQ